MSKADVLVFSEDPETYQALSKLLPESYTTAHIASFANWDALDLTETLFLALVLPEGQELALFKSSIPILETLPVVLVTSTPQPAPTIINTALEYQLLAVLVYPFDVEDARDTLLLALERQQHISRQRYLQENAAEVNRRLNQRLQEINTIYTVGKFVTASLSVEEVLMRIVSASVNLTQADEGFALLKEGDALYLRVSKGTQSENMQSSRIEVNDDIAWQVIRSGRPTLLKREVQVATGLVAQSLLYVPLPSLELGTIGVLGVANVDQGNDFSENHLFTLSSVADFAAIALENARLFDEVETEQSRLSTILEHATEAILVTDTQNRLLLWSNTAAQVFEIGEDALGQPIDAIVDHDGIHELFYHKAAPRPMLHTEVALADGQVFNAQLSSIPNLGRVAIMQDITHLKELDHLKSEFVSTVSHDLRTPLTTVQGYIELLARVGPVNTTQSNFIKKAMSSLSHITSLIGDLLDIGRIEAGYDLEMTCFCLDKLANRTVETYTLHAEAQGIDLFIESPGSPIWIRGNVRRIRQVIENLLSNAIKYNRPGGWIKVRIVPDNQHVVVEVEDNGIGIALEEQPKLFERFYRVHTPETEDIHGTGLGLAIVKSVVERHKGRVWVKSTPGKGSTFAFILPSCDEEEIAALEESTSGMV